MFRTRWTIVAFTLATSLLPLQSRAAEQAPVFSFPVDCTIGIECFVQNYVDLAPGATVQDYACGQLSYNGHKGTDIRVRDLGMLEKGIPVLAAAKGRVVGLRDGEPDRNFRDIAPGSIKNKECGNGVLLDHGKGWLSQYCHLKKGSLLVQKGKLVSTGQPLGQMGLSGKTVFPHLHFEIKRGKRFIDPFTGLHQRPAGNCNGQDVAGSLWKSSLSAKLPYRTSGVIRSGFAVEMIDIKDVEQGKFKSLSGSTSAPLILFWAQIYGLRPGDRNQFLVTFPNGKTFAKSTNIHDGRHKAQWLSWVGKRRPEGAAWPSGQYVGRYVLSRKTAKGNWQRIISIKRKFSLSEH